VNRGQFEETGENHHRCGVVLGRSGNSEGAALDQQPSVSQHRMAGENDLIHPGHHGEDGGVRNEGGLNSRLGQSQGHLLPIIPGSGFSYDDLEFPLLGRVLQELGDSP